jgi:hypothetical protein
MLIDLSLDQKNADGSIRINFDSFWKRTDSSERHHAKHEWQRISTDDGMTIDFKPDQ